MFPGTQMNFNGEKKSRILYQITSPPPPKKKKCLLCPAPGLLHDLQGGIPRTPVLEGRPGAFHGVKSNLGKQILLRFIVINYSVSYIKPGRSKGIERGIAT